MFLSADLVITEFMASNGATLDDGDGNSSDWIELYNGGDRAVDLAGYRLTDQQDNLSRWVFPQVVLPPGNYLVVFASGQAVDDYVDAAGDLHTNFALNADGDYLALVSPDGGVVTQYGSIHSEYPRQFRDVSFGIGTRIGTGVDPDVGYMAAPTPGGPNLPADQILTGFVEDTKFSVDRGFYSTPQSVAISTATSGASVYFTTDGTRPDPANPTASRYTAPVLIESTTVLRAAAFRDGFLPTNVGTHTYIFPEDVSGQDWQSTLQAGFPPLWGDVEPDYGMDQRVIDEVGKEAMVHSLTSIPTISLVTDVHDVFGEDGIYTHSTQRGPAMERPVSAEWIPGDNNAGFQIDAGIQIHGAASRSHNFSKKHSFRLLFKSEYGPGKLTYALYDDPDAAHEFDTLVLRAGAHDSWSYGPRLTRGLSDTQFTRDEFHRRTQLAMGQLSAHGSWAHLYLNGVYWGLYNIVERPDDSFGAAYFGVPEDTWDGFSDRLDAPGVVNAGYIESSSGQSVFTDPARANRAVDAWQSLVDMTRRIPSLLFRVSGFDAASSLDSGQIPVALHEKFEDAGHPLTESASVSVVESEYRWRIVDATGEYQVERRPDSLNVYLQSPASAQAANAAYQALLGNRPDGTNNPDQRAWLDAENYVDYLILNHYGGDVDWPRRDFYVGGENGLTSTGFKFFAWDTERSMLFKALGARPNVRSSYFNMRFSLEEGVQSLLPDLRHSSDFRMLFADRIHQHYFNGGTLYVDAENPEWDPTNPHRNVPAARYVKITGEIYDALLAESARWGDQHRSELPYTRDREWAGELENLLENWFPQRSEVMLERYREAGLYPDVQAPQLNQHGGDVARGSAIVMENPNQAGTLYYTLDGSDPRSAGGGVSATAFEMDGNTVSIHGAVQVKARILLDGQWSALNCATFTVRTEQAPVYRAGDANRDSRFDQFDIVQVLQTAKYQSGQPADWTEGDWNGDRQFNRLDIVVALQTGSYLKPAATLREQDFGALFVKELLRDQVDPNVAETRT